MFALDYILRSSRNPSHDGSYYVQYRVKVSVFGVGKMLLLKCIVSYKYLSSCLILFFRGSYPLSAALDWLIEGRYLHSFSSIFLGVCSFTSFVAFLRLLVLWRWWMVLILGGGVVHSLVGCRICCSGRSRVSRRRILLKKEEKSELFCGFFSIV